jgi:hypothetical protein
MQRVLVAVVSIAFVASCSNSRPDQAQPVSENAPSTALSIGQDLTSPTSVAVPLNFRSHLGGEHEVPARETHAQGQAIFQLDRSGTALEYKLIASNISNVFQAHLHLGAAGTNGPIVVWLYPSTTPGAGPLGGGRTDGVLAEGTIRAANMIGSLAGQPLSALMQAIESGNIYVNVHTNDGVAPTNTGPGDFPGGEIRGQM